MKEQDEGLGRLVSGFLTALPIALISLASCVSYAHLMQPLTTGSARAMWSARL